MNDLTIRSEFLTPESMSDPYPTYRELRESGPIFRALDHKGRDVVVVTSYALVKEVFSRPQDFSSLLGPFLTEGTDNADADAILDANITGRRQPATLLLILDDPEHKRLRAIVNTVFTPKRITALAENIQLIVNELIDAFIASGEVDFIHDFATLLPLHVILDVLGIDRAMTRKAQVWSDASLVRVGKLGTHEDEIEAAKLIVEMQEFFYQTMVERRANPRNDLFSDIVHAKLDNGEGLTDDQLIGLFQELLIAGNETTRNSLIGGTVLFLRNPDQLQAMMGDPAVVPNAVEEVLRLFAPKAGMWRIVSRDTELGGVKLAAGTTLMVRMDAANRDDAQFPDGESFDIRRPNARNHLAFGFGVHNCLGNLLARKELQVAFPILFRRLKNMKIDEARSDFGRHPSVLMHALNELTVTFDPS